MDTTPLWLLAATALALWIAIAVPPAAHALRERRRRRHNNY